MFFFSLNKNEEEEEVSSHFVFAFCYEIKKIESNIDRFLREKNICMSNKITKRIRFEFQIISFEKVLHCKIFGRFGRCEMKKIYILFP